jgi:hypothetical protein
MTKLFRNISVLVFIVSMCVGFVYEKYSANIGGEASWFTVNNKHFLINGYEYIEVEKVIWVTAMIFKYIHVGFFLLSILGGFYLMVYMLFLRKDDDE